MTLRQERGTLEIPLFLSVCRLIGNDCNTDGYKSALWALLYFSRERVRLDLVRYIAFRGIKLGFKQVFSRLQGAAARIESRPHCHSFMTTRD